MKFIDQGSVVSNANLIFSILFRKMVSSQPLIVKKKKKIIILNDGNYKFDIKSYWKETQQKLEFLIIFNISSQLKC